MGVARSASTGTGIGGLPPLMSSGVWALGVRPQSARAIAAAVEQQTGTTDEMQRRPLRRR
jgi:hypothetical protein